MNIFDHLLSRPPKNAQCGGCLWWEPTYIPLDYPTPYYIKIGYCDCPFSSHRNDVIISRHKACSAFSDKEEVP